MVSIYSFYDIFEHVFISRVKLIFLLLASDTFITFLAAILLSIIYIEVCRRLNLTIVGSRVGEDFLIWPQTGNPEVRGFEALLLISIYFLS